MREKQTPTSWSFILVALGNSYRTSCLEVAHSFLCLLQTCFQACHSEAQSRTGSGDVVRCIWAKVLEAERFWSCLREKGIWQFHSLNISVPSPPLHPHSPGYWQVPNCSPCFWTRFLLTLLLDQESESWARWWIILVLWAQWSPSQLLSIPLQYESNTDNAERGGHGCVPAERYEDRWGARFVSQARVCWALLYTWGQSHLSKRQVESYLSSYLKTSSASPSALNSSQKLVDWASCQLSHWRLHYGPPNLQFLSLGFVSVIPLHTCPLSPEGCWSSCHHAS